MDADGSYIIVAASNLELQRKLIERRKAERRLIRAFRRQQERLQRRERR